MEPVARRLLGDPNPRLSTPKILRWGANGSLAVDVEKGVFFDNETKVGGGVVDFGMRQLLMSREQSWTWLREEYPSAFQQDLPHRSKPNGDGRRHHAGRIEATYDYPGADGVLLFQVQRKADPKSFIQRRPVGDRWAYDKHGVPEVPYRLPELIADVAAGRLIWIVEGEKDVDRLRGLGLAATCNAGGAGKWKRELNAWLKGADVVVVADNDQAGYDHAVAVAAQLRGLAARVRVLVLGQAWPDCPAKGDASDFLDAGKTPEDLDALAGPLPDWAPPTPAQPGAFTADVLAPIPVPPRLWHVEGLIPGQQVTLLGGDGGVGKSTLALQLAAATVAGLEWLGMRPRSGRALYVSCEDDRDELHRRLDRIGLHYGLGLDSFADLKLWPLADEDALLVLGQPGQPLQTTERWGEFRAMVDDWRPALIVVDSSADVYGAGESERAQVRGFIRSLRGVCAACSGALVLLAHPSLAGLSSGSGLSGSTAWNNSVRSRLYLTLPPTEDGAPAATDLRVLQVKKANYGPSGGDLVVRYQTGAFVLDQPGAVNALDRAVAADRVDQLFLQLLDASLRQGRFVSHNSGHAYAPVLFARDPAAHGVSAKAFSLAMHRLFSANVLRVGSKGAPSRRISFIERAPDDG